MTHLHVHSKNGSLYDGISDVTELVDQAVNHGDKSIALTDHGMMNALFKFQQYAKSKNIKPILGMEAYIVDELVTMSGKKRTRMKNNHIILLASNKKGWENLCHLNYISNSDEEHFYYKPRISFDELFRYKEGLVVGSACLASPFSNLIKFGREQEAVSLFERFYTEFGENFYAEIQLNEITDEQKSYNNWIISMATHYGVPIVITGDVHYATPDGADTQKFLFNLRKEEESEGDDTYRCKSLFYQSVEDFKEFNKKWSYGYSEQQIEEWCKNTDKIADKCNFTIPLGKGMKLPRYSFDEETDFCKLAKEGLAKHFKCDYENCPKEYKERLEYELQLLLKKGAHRYLLTVAMLVNHSKSEGYMFGLGRGSGAGSLTCTCLGITSWAMDPLKYKLLFERFVSPSRLVTNIYDYFGEK